MPLTAAESGTERKYALRAFLLSFILGVLSFAWTMLLHRGLFSVAGDFNVQQIPFAMYANDAVKSGNVIWDWSLDLGSNFIGGMTFYILGNPSFWLSPLFPSDMFMYHSRVALCPEIRGGRTDILPLDPPLREESEPRAHRLGDVRLLGLHERESAVLPFS